MQATGYIGRVEKWEEFRLAWKPLMDSENIEIFDPASLEGRFNKYEGWSNAKKISFQQRVFKIINEAREVALGHSLSIRDFSEKMKLKLDWIDEPNGELKTYFYHCALCLLRNVRLWIEAENIQEPIEYIFESGDLGWGGILKVLEEINADPIQRDYYHMQGYSRKFKRDVVQLQAAGTWAYESFKHWANTEIAGNKRPIRKSFKSLFRPTVDSKFNTFDDYETLAAMLKDYVKLGGEAFRGGKPIDV